MKHSPREIVLCAWLARGELSDAPIDLTQGEIDQLMGAIHTSYAFRRWVLSMEWAYLKAELRKAFAPVVEAWRNAWPQE